jgi:transcriptional regulator with XRE-family HTH domain
MDDGLTFGEWLEDRYLALGLNQTTFGAAVGVRQNTVSGWKRDEKRPQSDDVLQRMAEVLSPAGVTVEEVYARAGRRRRLARATVRQIALESAPVTLAEYERLVALRDVQTQLQRAMDTISAILDDAGVIIVRPGEE